MTPLIHNLWWFTLPPPPKKNSGITLTQLLVFCEVSHSTGQGRPTGTKGRFWWGKVLCQTLVFCQTLSKASPFCCQLNLILVPCSAPFSSCASAQLQKESAGFFNFINYLFELFLNTFSFLQLLHGKWLFHSIYPWTARKIYFFLFQSVFSEEILGGSVHCCS